MAWIQWVDDRDRERAKQWVARLEQAAARRGIGITELAERLGVSRATVYLWRRGQVPRPETIRRAEEVFGVRWGE
jgi:transcriptional regulator with XRE-family HTH domain